MQIPPRTTRTIIATLVVLLGVGINIALGMWQLQRHQQRIEINNRINTGMAQAAIPLTATSDTSSLDYRRVSLRGSFDPEHEIVLRNRAYGNVTGVHLITPFRLANSDVAVLVDRGWIPMIESDRENRRKYPPPTGELVLEGIALQSQENLPGPKDPPLAAGETRLDAWFQINIRRIQTQMEYPLLPVFVELQPEPGAPATSFPIRQATTDLGPGSHLGYAVQWFAFGVIMLVVYIVWMLKQTPRSATSDQQPASVSNKHVS